MKKSNEVVFIPARCSKTGKNFFIREDIGADGMWVRTYGLQNISTTECGGEVETTIDFNNHRVGPQYKCPHCGNKYVFFCTNCDVKACCYDGGNYWHCPITKKTGEFSSGYIKSVTGNKGRAQ